MREPLKVLHITRSEELGIRAVMLGILTYVDRTQFSMKVAGPLKGPLIEDLARLEIPTAFCPVERDIKLTHDVKNLAQMCRLIQREQPDVLHLHGAKAGFLGRIAGWLNGVPAIVYTPNNDYLDEPNASLRNSVLVFLEKCVAQLGGQIVSVTKEERASWLARGICPESNIVTIHDGFDFSRASDLIDQAQAKNTLGIAEHCNVIGMIARLVPQKAPHIFLQAAAQVLRQRPNTRFLIVGAGPLDESLKTLSKSLGIDQQVHYLGYVANLSHVYSAMDASVLTSLYEGLPMVILESMYLRIPVILPRIYGVNEVVPEGCGIVTAINDPDGTANAILYVLDNPKSAIEMADRAHRHATAYFGAAQMSERYQRLYLSLLSRRQTVPDQSEIRQRSGYVEPNAASPEFPHN
ncbi:MAG TPA: glycosyltransferase [Terriglobales bacterium]|jgi:glycosyltransferase involved in cell wall biosynthesis